MKVLLTSFENARQYEEDERVEVYSGARWQPSGFNYPEASWMKPLDADGIVNIRHFAGDVDAYYEYLYQTYTGRAQQRLFWTAKIEVEYVVVACWCPHTKAARRQMHQFGSFVCHLIPLARVLEEAGWDVVLDEDRSNHARPMKTDAEILQEG